MRNWTKRSKCEWMIWRIDSNWIPFRFVVIEQFSLEPLTEFTFENYVTCPFLCVSFCIVRFFFTKKKQAVHWNPKLMDCRVMLLSCHIVHTSNSKMMIKWWSTKICISTVSLCLYVCFYFQLEFLFKWWIIMTCVAHVDTWLSRPFCTPFESSSSNFNVFSNSDAKNTVKNENCKCI